MKYDKNNDPFFSKKQRKKNKAVLKHANDRISHIRRNMSRGAANIYRMIKRSCKWGNKQLWGNNEKE